MRLPRPGSNVVARALLALTLLAAALDAGCKRERTTSGDAAAGPVETDPAKMPKVASSQHQLPGTDELFREQERLENGERFDEPLLRPTIRVAAGGVSIGAQAIADVVLATDRAARVEALFSWLKTDREHWLMIRPGQHFGGHAELLIEPSVDATAAFNVLETVLVSGFDADVTVGPTGFVSKGLASPSGLDVAWLEPGAGDAYQLRFGGRLGCKLPLGVRAVRTPADGAAALKEGCEGAPEPCIQVLFVKPRAGAEAGPVADLVASTLGALPKRQTPPMVVAQLSPHWQLAECEGWPKPAAASATPAPSAAPAASTERPSPRSAPAPFIGSDLSCDGPLAVNALREALERQSDGLRRCYEKGLEADPTLTGRLSVRLVVQRDGRVAGVTATSDLPDEAVIACGLAEMARLTLPPQAAGSTKAFVPLMFMPPR